MSEYPKMIYADDGRTHVLPSEDADRPDGKWTDQPSEVHFRSGGLRIPDVPSSGKDDLSVRVQRLCDLLERMVPNDDEQPSQAPEATSRRGRPPGSRNRPVNEEDTSNGE